MCSIIWPIVTTVAAFVGIAIMGAVLRRRFGSPCLAFENHVQDRCIDGDSCNELVMVRFHARNRAVDGLTISRVAQMELEATVFGSDTVKMQRRRLIAMTTRPSEQRIPILNFLSRIR